MQLLFLAAGAPRAGGPARSLRREGFLASASLQDEKPLVVVYCLKEDQDEVVRRVRITDPHAKPVTCP
jgi:hypothetical protein